MNLFPHNSLFLAPMADITHAAFRKLVDSFGGCDYYFTEMVSAGAYISGSPYSEFYTITTPKTDRTIIQLAGNETNYLCRAAEDLSRRDIFGIDINMGCSAPEIFRKGWGCAWMKNQEGAYRLIKTLKLTVDQGKTLSVKLRIGEQEDSKYLVDFSTALQEGGINFLTLNPRIRKQKLSRPGNWEYVELLRKHLTVPVIGNGDIRCFSTFRQRAEKSEVGSFMIGRGAAQKPWLFTLLKNKFRDPRFEMEIDLKEIVEQFFQLLQGNLHTDFHLSRLKRFFTYFSKNLTFGHRLNNEISNAPSAEAVRNLVDSYFERNPKDIMLVEG